jgi:hypothetical protein
VAELPGAPAFSVVMGRPRGRLIRRSGPLWWGVDLVEEGLPVLLPGPVGR